MPSRPITTMEEEAGSSESESESLQLGEEENEEGEEERSKALSLLQQQLKALSDDEDAAPDDVTFAASKQSALERLKEARIQAQHDATTQRLKRRDRQLAHFQLKKQKLAERGAGGEGGEGGESEDEGRDVVSSSATRDSTINEHIQFSDEEELAGETRNDDFIPLSGVGGLKPVCIKDVIRLVPGLDTARQFRQQQLFGGRVKRETMTQRLAGAEKKRARRSKVTSSH